MIIKEYILDESLVLPNYITNLLLPGKTAIFDIETLGLSRQNHPVILIGYLYGEDNKIFTKQFFAEGIEDEYLLLEAFHNEIAPFKNIITYNGASFDVPYLKARSEINDIPFSLYEKNHIDILRHIKKYKEYINTPDLKLKSIEKLLGINRLDTISGRESVLLYNLYTKRKSLALMNKILLHNYEDIYYLHKTLSVFEIIPMALWKTSRFSIEYGGWEVEFSYSPQQLVFQENSIQLEGSTSVVDQLPPVKYYDGEFSFLWNPTYGRFNLEILLGSLPLPNKSKVSFLDLSSLRVSIDTFVNQQDFIINDRYLMVSKDIKGLDNIKEIIDILICKAIKAS